MESGLPGPRRHVGVYGSHVAEAEEAWPEVGEAEVEKKGWILEVNWPGRSSGLDMCMCEKDRN